MESRWRALPRLGGHACRLGLGLVLLASGALKALDPEGFSREVAQYGILSGELARAFAYALVPLEVAVAAALLLNFRTVLSLSVATGLILIFIGAVGFAIATDQPLEGCGCFGRYAARTPVQTLVEDVVFLAMGVVGMITLRRGATPAPSPTPAPRGRWKRLALGAAALGSGAFVIASPHLPIDDLATGLRPGVDWGDVSLPLAEADLSRGGHLVAVLGLKEEASRAAVERLNALAARGLSVVGLHEDDEQAFNEFFWGEGPAFPLHYASPSDLRRLYRRAPRFFAVKDGVVTRTWEALPDVPRVEEALR